MYHEATGRRKKGHHEEALDHDYADLCIRLTGDFRDEQLPSLLPKG